MNSFFSSFTELISPLKDGDYLYLLLEPLFIYGITLGALGIIIAYIINNTPFQILTLSLIALSALTIFPYLTLRQKAQQRIEQVYKIEAPARAAQFKEITENRQAHLWLYLVVAITAGFAAMIGPRRNRLGLLFAVVCIVFSGRTILYSLSMHYQDTLIAQAHLKQNQSPVQKRLQDKSE
ncbi:MAG: hypothetical protein QM496_19305 [Verrucomicrobiota bacterium]